MQFTLIIALGTLVYTFVIFLKNLTAQQWSSAITQAIAWCAGIGGVFIMAATQFAGGISIGDMTLDRLDFWSKVLVGLLATSLLSTLHEFKKAIDRTDTAVVPEWFEPKAEATKRTHLVLPTSIATPDAMDAARRTIASSHTTPTSG
jgi:hypothetical protein